jgi:hypothetical protein
MNVFPSKLIATKSTHSLPTTHWLSQGLLLLASTGGVILILNELQRQRQEIVEVRERINGMEQHLAQLSTRVDRLNAQAADHLTSNSSPPSRPRPSRTKKAGSGESSELMSPPAERKRKLRVKVAKKTSGRRKPREPAPHHSIEAPGDCSATAVMIEEHIKIIFKKHSGV